MSDKTKIEWTDATVNAINGCTVFSPGCTNCYAMRLAGSRLRNHPSRAGLTIQTKAGPVWNGKVSLNRTALLQPLRWKRPRKIFWNAHGDLFHAEVPDEWTDEQFAVMAMTPQHIHQVLTKRTERMRGYLRNPATYDRISRKVNEWPVDEIGAGNEFTADFRLMQGQPLPNVWLGTSVEDQTRASERIPMLLQTPAAVRFLSCEPLLGALELRRIDTMAFRSSELIDALLGCGMDFLGHPTINFRGIDWVIAGGESGPSARPMHPEWVRKIRDDCRATGIPFLFKQWGAFRPAGPPTISLEADHRPVRNVFVHFDGKNSRPPSDMLEMGKKAAGRLLDGVEHNEMPA